jgi:hypothetical protein
MRNKTKIIPIMLFLSVFMILVSCQKQKAKWKGTIEEVDGVTIVKNPKEPMYGEEVFNYEIELSLGGAGGKEEYYFSSINHIYVDDEDRIHLTDYKESHVRIFDEEGKHLRTIGRRGEGPGELIRPRDVFITSQKQIVVADMRKLSLNFYTNEGEFLRSKTFGFLLFGTAMDSEGNIYGVVMTGSRDQSIMELRKFDSDFNVLHKICSSPLSPTGTFKVGLPSVYFQLAKDGRLVYGISDRYEIKIMDITGNVVKVIKKKYDPVEITEQEIEKFKEMEQPGLKIEIPKYYQAFMGILVDEEGNIIVQTFEKPENGEGHYYDFFDSEGKYIARFSLNIFPRIWKKNRFYTIEEGTAGFHVVRRYRVKWKY